MTRLINADATIDSIRECVEAVHDNYESDIEQGYLNAIECVEEQPTIDAVPIEFIEKRIAELKKLNEYEFIANGGYTSPSDYEQWELERLIRDWREQNDQIH